jgi:4-hydroxy-3-polyprenylbenzoate decarboxylase
MCIDGTKKFDEERDDSYSSSVGSLQIETETIKNKYSEIRVINTSLLKLAIPCLIVSVEKNRKGHVRELHQALSGLNELDGVKMILYVEHTVDANDLPVALWRFCNNLDPKRDSILWQGTSFADPSKNRALHGF